MSIEYLNKICGNPYYTEPTIPYVGTNIPLSGSYIGQLIQVDNAAVPGGRSNLRWNGTLWAPPAGEVIASEISYTTPLASLALPSTENAGVYDGLLIPDYMIPDGVTFGVEANATIFDTVAATANGYVVATFGASVPDANNSTNVYKSLIQSGQAAYSEMGACYQPMRTFRRDGTAIKGPRSQISFTPSPNGPQLSVGTIVPGNVCLRFAAKGTTTQTVKVWNYQIVSKGGL